MSKVILIDGHSILNRAYYGIPLLSNAEGLHTNAVYGFLNIMFKILDEEKADYLAVAFDVHAPTFRHEMFEAYKGTRKPMPEELREQVPLLKEVLGAMQIPTVSVAGYEADDVIGTLAKRFQQEGLEVSVVSGDRDLLQLSDEHILIRIPKTSRGQTQVHDYRPADVKEQYQVTPEEFIDVKGLMGDSSDNIPGVPSIGEKTATALIAQYHSIENTAGRVVRVDGEPVELTYTEFELLLYLMNNAGMALSRDKILDNVWRYDYYGDARTVDTHIKKLRGKLGEYGDHIRTIRGIGYKFEA